MSEGIWREEESSSEATKATSSEEALAENIWPEETTGKLGLGETGGAPAIDQDLWRSDEAASSQPLSQASEGNRRRNQDRGARRFRLRKIIVGLAVLMVATLAADIIYSAIGLRSSMQEAATRIESGASSLQMGDLEEAGEDFEASLLSSTNAVRLARRPGLSIVANVPGLDNDVLAIRALARASELAARAGQRGVQASSAMGAEGETLLAPLFFAGRVQIDNIEQGRPFIDEVSDLIAEAARASHEAPEPRLEAIRKALDEARERTTEARATARKGSVLFSALPQLLGADSPKRYMLAFQALGEARATGGLFGLYGVLDAKDGLIGLGTVAPIFSVFDEEAIEAVDGPLAFERNYGPQYALRQVQQVNVSPNFPVVAEVLLRMYEQEAGDRLDGVIAMDPITMEQLMQGMDPIESPFIGVPITSENVAKVLLVDSYLDKDQKTQNQFLADLVGRFWDQMKNVDDPRFVEGLGEAVRTGHLKMYSRDATSQEALSDLEADGGLPADPNLSMVFHNNYSGNKVDYYLRRNIDTKVTLTSSGLMRTVTRAKLLNAAPDGPASLLLGPPEDLAVEGDQPGLNRMIVNFLMPEGSITRSLTIDEAETEPFSYKEGRHVVAWDVVEIPPGDTVTATLTSEGTANVSRTGVFSMTLQPQTLVKPDRFRLRVIAPEGFLLEEAGRLVAQPASAFETSGVLDAPRTIKLQLVPR